MAMKPPTQDRVGVLAVDDQPIFLDVAQEVVTATHGFRWVAGVTCGEDALDAMAEHEPALVLLDVRMPGMDGIETARRISERHPDVVVVLISVEANPTMATAVERSGAAVLVRKQELGPAMLRHLWQTYKAAGP
jgi:DNA-binding NarL/FixJ family response regulator